MLTSTTEEISKVGQGKRTFERGENQFKNVAQIHLREKATCK